MRLLAKRPTTNESLAPVGQVNYSGRHHDCTSSRMTDPTGPIFVVGCGRSGTTLLRLMLNSHPRIAIPGETWYFPDLHADRTTIMRWPEKEWRDRLTQKIISLPVFPELGISSDALRDQLTTLTLSDWPAVIACANLAFAREEAKPRWGDKTPGYVRRLPVIKELFPDAIILHVIRDGRDVALSFLEQTFGPSSVLAGADYWRADVERGQSDGPRFFGDSYHEVRYEELVAHPARVLGEVCRAIGESYDPMMLNYHQSANQYLHEEHRWHDQTKSAPNRARSERWRREMTRDDEALFELAAGVLLQRLGYPLTRSHSLDALVAWGTDRLAKSWRAAILRTKITAYRLIHPK